MNVPPVDDASQNQCISQYFQRLEGYRKGYTFQLRTTLYIISISTKEI